MLSLRRLLFGGLVSLIALAFLGLGLSSAAQPSSPAQKSPAGMASTAYLQPMGVLTPTVWLPQVARPVPSSSIFGRVTVAGMPIGGIHLRLRFWDGSTFSTRLETDTGADGSYRFPNPPALLGGQSYYVSYMNHAQGGNVANPSYLSAWGGPDLVAYGGGDVSGGDFDIANIFLVNPQPDATVSLPTTFEWQPRASTPGDRYEWELFKIDTGEYWVSGQLGYRSSMVFSGPLPPGFTPLTPYGWDVYVHDGKGGMGMSYYWRRVTFSNAGLAAGHATTTNPVSLRPERLEELRAARAAGSADLLMLPGGQDR